MGIALRDQSGNLRRSEDLLGDVADAFARIEDPAERVPPKAILNRDAKILEPTALSPASAGPRVGPAVEFRLEVDRGAASAAS
jgi:hypothetical protein